jgi:hypothetical protein
VFDKPLKIKMKEITELGVVKIESNIPMDTDVDWNEIRNRYVYE